MDESPKIAILLLAAGESSRMGEHIKQILPWNNTTLLGNALEQAKSSIANAIYVVLGAYEEKIKGEVNLDAATIIQNSNWKNGLGSSITAGVEYFSSKSLTYDAVLVLLADQPKIDTNYLNKMMGNWRANPQKIIATQYKSHSGVPAIFGKDYFQELQELKKDFGAKDILASHNDAILALNSGGKEIDIDSWETYQELIKPQ